MTISIGNYQFHGPFNSTENLENQSGIYAILDHVSGQYYVLDIGESSEVKNRIEGHDRKPCWIKNAKGSLEVAVYYTPNQQQSKRTVIEQELREQFRPCCGDK